MEELLLASSSSSTINKTNKNNISPAKTNENYKESCKFFAYVLSNIEEYITQDLNEQQTQTQQKKSFKSSPSPSPSSTKVAKLPPKNNNNDKSSSETIDKWLYDKCYKIHNSQSDNALSMSLSILSIISENSTKKKRINEQQKEKIQSYLFEIIGVDNFDFLSEIMNDNIINDIKSNVTDDGLIQYSSSLVSNNNTTTNNNKHYSKNNNSQRNNTNKISNMFDSNNILNEVSNFDNTHDNLNQKDLKPEGTKQYYEPKGLSKGTTREYGDGYLKVTIPMKRATDDELHPRLILKDIICSKFCNTAFDGVDSLNPMQSTVFNVGYHTSENLLICAPTGVSFSFYFLDLNKKA